MMPFGFKSALGTFHLAIDLIPSTEKWQFALMYVDDIVRFSRTLHVHIDHLRQVMTLLTGNNVMNKLKNCEFFTNCINHSGYGILPGCLEESSNTTDWTRNLKLLKNFIELCSFLGLCNVFRRFVPNFPHIAAPLKESSVGTNL